MAGSREADVFRRYSGGNKLKVILITAVIVLIVFLSFYFFAKSLFTYTITFVTNGGTVVESKEYKFLEKTEQPLVKKEGYYIVKWSKDKNFHSTFKFGRALWKSVTVYTQWDDGVALVLNFAEGEENADMTTADLKVLHEQYVKAGSVYTLPQMYNMVEDSERKGEQLMWYDNSECAGQPFDVKTYTVDHNIMLYGRWFDTLAEKFSIDDGTLLRYNGRCDKVILPSGITKIKDIQVEQFQRGSSDQVNEQDGANYSAFQYVWEKLKEVYINAEMTHLGDCSFKGLATLKNVYFLGNKVVSIGDSAFEDCHSLKEIILPESVQVVGVRSFRETRALTKIHVGENLTEIKDGAFINATSLREITLPNVTFIGKSAFSMCTSLTKLVLASDTFVSTNVALNETASDKNILFGAINAVGEKIKIYVPYYLVTSYKNVPPWSHYGEYIYSMATLEQ